MYEAALKVKLQFDPFGVKRRLRVLRASRGSCFRLANAAKALLFKSQKGITSGTPTPQKSKRKLMLGVFPFVSRLYI